MSGTAARLHGQGKVRDIYDVGRAFEPEQREPRQDATLVRDRAGQDHVERADAVSYTHLTLPTNSRV